MGWASAGYAIFNPTIEALVRSKAPDEVLFDTAVNLINNLQSEDWDTEHESLDHFKDNPVIVRAFASLNIRLHHSTYERLSDLDLQVIQDSHSTTANAHAYVPKLLMEINRLRSKLIQEYDETEP